MEEDPNGSHDFLTLVGLVSYYGDEDDKTYSFNIFMKMHASQTFSSVFIVQLFLYFSFVKSKPVSECLKRE